MLAKKAKLVGVFGKAGYIGMYKAYATIALYALAGGWVVVHYFARAYVAVNINLPKNTAPAVFLLAAPNELLFSRTYGFVVAKGADKPLHKMGLHKAVFATFNIA